MAVQPGPTFKRYAANGAATVYTIPFLLLDPANLQITLNGVAVTSGFTLAGLGNASSSCTFYVAPTGDLLFQQVMQFQRLTDYQMNGDFLSQTVNGDYDRLWLAIKQLNRDDGRALAVSPLEPEGIPALPVKALRNLKLLAFDAAGNPAPSNLTLLQLEQQPALALASAAEARAFADDASESADRSGGLANQSGDFAVVAEGAATQAESAASIASAISKSFPSIADGIAATSGSGAANRFFSVPTTGDSLAILYRNDAGIAVEIGRAPSDAAVAEVAGRITDNESVILAVTDDAGFAGVECTPISIKTAHLELSTERLKMGDQSLERSDDAAVTVIDDFGFVGFLLPNSGFEPDVEPPKVGFTADEVLQANQLGLTSASKVVRFYNTEVARLVWQYNHFLSYGQSLETGFEAWPALSKSPRLGNMMLGNSVRPASRVNGAFVPLGVSNLTPMKAVVQDSGAGGTILTDAQVAALAPGASNEGEASVVGMTNFAKLLHNQRLQVANDESRTFIASSCGVNGQTIEQLTKGDSSNRWLRLTQAAEKVKAIAVAEGKTYGIAGVVFMQGEFNYSTAWGGVATLAEYKAKLSALYDDIENDIVAAVAGQSQPPLFLTYQTGASYTNDANNLAIGMAQWELSEERRNWVMATPVYQYPDKGGHLTSNSYRWVGKQFAKVWHRVVELGQDWKPLSPLAAVIREREALITFHVPHPPLAFDTPYVLRTAMDYASKGFSALDSAGALGVSSVELVADCVVRLVFVRDPVGPVFIRYADKATHNGNGCLRDSDPTVSDDLYEYTAGSGQYADENIAALVGKPYPLHNWCIAFHIPAVGAE